MKQAAALYLTMPGVPFLYYGEEVGMSGTGPDEDNRRPMQWTAGSQAGFTAGSPWRAPNTNFPQFNVATMQADPASLLSHYKTLIRLRNTHEVLRKGYYLPATTPAAQFSAWWQQALETKISEPNAMTLATASADGVPSARIVLLKGFNEDGFVFFTNYNSYKGLQLAENPKACLVFFWKELERQVRITGLAAPLSVQDSDAYFNSRPEGSRIGAWASPQSQVIESREWLDAVYKEFAAQLQGSEITRPPHWGGYVITPVVVEFWQGRPSRLHDRLQYTLEADGTWKRERLAP
jgi:pyridoxamine 5'-phosphate oxidase